MKIHVLDRCSFSRLEAFRNRRVLSSISENAIREGYWKTTFFRIRHADRKFSATRGPSIPLGADDSVCGNNNSNNTPKQRQRKRGYYGTRSCAPVELLQYGTISSQYLWIMNVFIYVMLARLISVLGMPFMKSQAGSEDLPYSVQYYRTTTSSPVFMSGNFCSRGSLCPSGM